MIQRARVAGPLFAMLVFLLPCCASAQEGGAAPDLDTIVTRLEHAQVANRTQLESYEVTREYQFFAGSEAKPDSRVIADVQFAPPHEKSYTIAQPSNSSRTNGVVKKILDHEVEAARQNSDHDISRQNYDFRFLGEQVKDGVRCYALQITAKRKDKSLLNGIAWIDAANYLPWRVEGDVSKSPSWWIRSLHVKMRFAAVDGMWLQAGGMGQADVRIFGLHTVTTRDLSYRTSQQVAARRTRRPSHADAFIGAGLPRD